MVDVTGVGPRVVVAMVGAVVVPDVGDVVSTGSSVDGAKVGCTGGSVGTAAGVAVVGGGVVGAAVAVAVGADVGEPVPSTTTIVGALVGAVGATAVGAATGESTGDATGEEGPTAKGGNVVVPEYTVTLSRIPPFAQWSSTSLVKNIVLPVGLPSSSLKV